MVAISTRGRVHNPSNIRLLDRLCSLGVVMEWQTLKEWATLHGMTPKTAAKLIEDGLLATEDYIHRGKIWRINPQAGLINKATIKLPPCKDFLKELEAI